ncbi:unnamed protein product [Malus baccata var. baccata]
MVIRTRSKNQVLIPYDLEPERSARKLAREKYLAQDSNLGDTFLKDLFRDPESSTSIFQPLAPVAHMALALPATGQPLRNSLAVRVNAVPRCIIYPDVEDETTFEIKPHILNILPSFHGLPNNDPNMHLVDFIEACDNTIIRGFSSEVIKTKPRRGCILCLPIALQHGQNCKKKFLNKFFPSSKTLALKNEILAFAQKPNEFFHEAWERYNEMYTKCPYAGFDSNLQMNIFYDGLNATTKSQVNASVGGSLMSKSAREAFELFDMMAFESQQWIEEQTQKRGSSPNVSAKIAKMEKNFNAKSLPCPMPKKLASFVVRQLITQCLNKDSYPELVQEHVNMLAQHMSTLSNSTNNFVQSIQTSIQNLTASVGNLETQVGQLATMFNEKEKGKFPSQFEQNPRGMEHCKVIRTLRSGKSYDNRKVVHHEAEVEEEEFIQSEGELKPTSVSLQLVDRSVTYPLGTLTLIVQGESVVFKLFEAIKRHLELEECFRVDVLDEIVHANFASRSSNDELLTCLTNHDATLSMEENMVDVIAALDSAPIHNPKWRHVYESLRVPMQPILSSSEQAPKLELKLLPSHLKYAHLGVNETLFVIIAADLNDTEEDKLLRVLRKYQDALGWTLADIKGISPALCMHRIFMEVGTKLTIEAQRRLNPIMKEVVRVEVMKLLDAGI